MRKTYFVPALLFTGAMYLQAQPKPKERARDLGIPFLGKPGKYNAVTDVPGVEVGYKTLVEGSGPLVVGKGPIRTGGTVILPKGKAIFLMPLPDILPTVMGK